MGSPAASASEAKRDRLDFKDHLESQDRKVFLVSMADPVKLVPSVPQVKEDQTAFKD
jgi:hypothetical protein